MASAWMLSGRLRLAVAVFSGLFFRLYGASNTSTNTTSTTNTTITTVILTTATNTTSSSNTTSSKKAMAVKGEQAITTGTNTTISSNTTITTVGMHTATMNTTSSVNTSISGATTTSANTSSTTNTTITTTVMRTTTMNTTSSSNTTSTNEMMQALTTTSNTTASMANLTSASMEASVSINTTTIANVTSIGGTISTATNTSSTTNMTAVFWTSEQLTHSNTTTNVTSTNAGLSTTHTNTSTTSNSTTSMAASTTTTTNITSTIHINTSTTSNMTIVSMLSIVSSNATTTTNKTVGYSSSLWSINTSTASNSTAQHTIPIATIQSNTSTTTNASIVRINPTSASNTSTTSNTTKAEPELELETNTTTTTNATSPRMTSTSASNTSTTLNVTIYRTMTTSTSNRTTIANATVIPIASTSTRNTSTTPNITARLTTTTTASNTTTTANVTIVSGASTSTSNTSTTSNSTVHQTTTTTTSNTTRTINATTIPLTFTSASNTSTTSNVTAHHTMAQTMSNTTTTTNATLVHIASTYASNTSTTSNTTAYTARLATTSNTSTSTNATMVIITSTSTNNASTTTNTTAHQTMTMTTSNTSTSTNVSVFSTTSTSTTNASTTSNTTTYHTSTATVSNTTTIMNSTTIQIPSISASNTSTTSNTTARHTTMATASNTTTTANASILPIASASSSNTSTTSNTTEAESVLVPETTNTTTLTNATMGLAASTSASNTSTTSNTTAHRTTSTATSNTTTNTNVTLAQLASTYLTNTSTTSNTTSRQTTTTTTGNTSTTTNATSLRATSTAVSNTSITSNTTTHPTNSMTTSNSTTATNATVVSITSTSASNTSTTSNGTALLTTTTSTSNTTTTNNATIIPSSLTSASNSSTTSNGTALLTTTTSTSNTTTTNNATIIPSSLTSASNTSATSNTTLHHSTTTTVSNTTTTTNVTIIHLTSTVDSNTSSTSNVSTASASQSVAATSSTASTISASTTLASALSSSQTTSAPQTATAATPSSTVQEPEPSPQSEQTLPTLPPDTSTSPIPSLDINSTDINNTETTTTSPSATSTATLITSLAAPTSMTTELTSSLLSSTTSGPMTTTLRSSPSSSQTSPSSQSATSTTPSSTAQELEPSPQSEQTLPTLPPESTISPTPSLDINSTDLNTTESTTSSLATVSVSSITPSSAMPPSTTSITKTLKLSSSTATSEPLNPTSATPASATATLTSSASLSTTPLTLATILTSTVNPPSTQTLEPEPPPESTVTSTSAATTAIAVLAVTSATNVSFPVITLLKAEMVQSFTRLQLTFDDSVQFCTTPANCLSGAILDCSLLFDSTIVDSFGTSPICSFLPGNVILQVELGSGGVLQQGALITIRPDTLFPKSGIDAIVGGLFAFIAYTESPRPSAVHVATPPYISICSSATFSAVSSTGHFGRPLDFIWQLSAATYGKIQSNHSLQAVIDAANKDNTPMLRFSSSDIYQSMGEIESDVILEIEVQVVNFLGYRSATSASIVITPGDVTSPQLSPARPLWQDIYDSDGITLAIHIDPVASASACAGNGYGNYRAVDVSWEYWNRYVSQWLDVGDSGVNALSDLSAEATILKLAPFLFEPSSVHVFRVTAAFADAPLGENSTLTFTVNILARPPPVAVLHVPLEASPLCGFMLDASSSHDQHGKPTDALVYSWQRRIDEISLPLFGVSGSTLRILPSQLSEGTYNFSVSVKRAEPTDATSSTASALVRVSNDASPAFNVKAPWSPLEQLSVQARIGNVIATVRGDANCALPSQLSQAYQWVLVAPARGSIPATVLSLLETSVQTRSFQDYNEEDIITSDFPGHIMQAGQHYAYALLNLIDSLSFTDSNRSLPASLESSVALVALSHTFIADAAPSSGIINLLPALGEAVRTDFSIATLNWHDEQVSTLEFEFYVFPMTGSTLKAQDNGKLVADIPFTVPEINWEDPSNAAFWSRLGGFELQVWDASKEASRIFSPGSYFTVVRARDLVGGITSKSILGPLVTETSTPLSVAEVSDAIAIAVSKHDAKQIFNSVHSVSITATNAPLVARQAALVQGIGALNFAVNAMTPTDGNLLQMGQTVTAVVASGGELVDTGVLQEASRVISNGISRALASDAKGVTEAAGTAILGSIVSIFSAGNDSSVAKDTMALADRLALASSSFLEASSTQDYSQELAALDSNGRGIKISILRYTPEVLRRRLSEEACTSITVHRTEWVRTNPYFYADPAKGYNRYIMEDSDVGVLNVLQCGKAMSAAKISESFTMSLELPDPGPKQFQMEYLPRCAFFWLSDGAWRVIPTVEVNESSITCGTPYGAGAFTAFEEEQGCIVPFDANGRYELVQGIGFSAVWFLTCSLGFAPLPASGHWSYCENYSPRSPQLAPCQNSTGCKGAAAQLSNSNCPETLAEGDSCMANCGTNHITVGVLQCSLGELVGVSTCIKPGQMANTSTLNLVAGRLEIFFPGAVSLTESMMKQALVGALGIDVEMVYKSELTSGTLRRLSGNAQGNTTFTLKYEVIATQNIPVRTLLLDAGNLTRSLPATLSQIYDLPAAIVKTIVAPREYTNTLLWPLVVGSSTSTSNEPTTTTATFTGTTTSATTSEVDTTTAADVTSTSTNLLVGSKPDGDSSGVTLAVGMFAAGLSIGLLIAAIAAVVVLRRRKNIPVASEPFDALRLAKVEPDMPLAGDAVWAEALKGDIRAQQVLGIPPAIDTYSFSPPSSPRDVFLTFDLRGDYFDEEIVVEQPHETAKTRTSPHTPRDYDQEVAIFEAQSQRGVFFPTKLPQLPTNSPPLPTELSAITCIIEGPGEPPVPLQRLGS